MGKVRRVIVESRDEALIQAGDILIANASVAVEIGHVLAGRFLPPAGKCILTKSSEVAVEDLAGALLCIA